MRGNYFKIRFRYIFFKIHENRGSNKKLKIVNPTFPDHI